VNVLIVTSLGSSLGGMVFPETLERGRSERDGAESGTDKGMSRAQYSHNEMDYAK